MINENEIEKRLCEDCKEVDISSSHKNRKYCETCIEKNKNKKRNERLSSKKRKELNENFSKVNPKGLNLLPENFNTISPINYYSYTNHFKTTWLEILEYYDKVADLMLHIKIKYKEFIELTRTKDIYAFAKSIGTSQNFFERLSHDEIRDSVGLINQNANEEDRIHNFFNVVRHLGRYPFTIQEFRNYSKISFETYINRCKPKGVQIEGIVEFFIAKEEFNTYKEERKKYLRQNDVIRSEKMTGVFQYSDQEIIKEIKKIVDKNIDETGCIPLLKELDSELRFSANIIKDRFNMTYFEFLESLGYKIEERYNSEKKVIYLISKILEEDPKNQATFHWLKSDKNNALRCDAFFVGHNLVIEYDGEQHFFPVDFAGRGQDWAELQFQQTKRNDQIKNTLIPQNGIKLIRIAYNDQCFDENFLRGKLIENGIIIPLEQIFS